MSKTFQFGNGEWAVGKETVLAYNSENNNFKPLPFTFDRASTATVVNKQGLIETVGVDEPRIDFLNNTKGHLLLEPQRTNLITYSEDLTSDWYSSSNGTGSTPVITSNNTIAPDGNNTADKIVLDTNGGTTSSDWSFITFSYTSSATTFTLSCYLKGVNGGEEIFFDFDNGNSNLITLTTEWVRYEFIKTVDTTTTRFIRIGLRGGSTTDDTASFYMWGAQLEAGSYATSYIPTQGSAVTRSAETAIDGGNNQVINSTEGVLYIETSALANDLSERRFGISDGTSSNVVRVGYTSVSNRIIAVVYNGSNQAVLTYTSSDITQNSKIAVKYKENDFALWVDGQERSTDTFGSVFPANTLNSLDFNIGGGSHFYNETKDVRVYNTALTDAELQALTS